ncbi:subunit 17 of mediator complex-domain-containing protein [Amylocarpus encephaloides]|uniref:Mediator of RNA polymerase II transcription subunit 17 n=1 Tax=Amylocarpus encephaloides TaxID=45428 RepID=A0A9P7YPX2_9HELO|nr:subunit 17 of mediator complex-domain-containing protein [Amylocarpus encephaloides]
MNSTIPNGTPISLRSWPSSSKPQEQDAISVFFERINREQGGLRSITEDGLRQEIAEAEEGKAGKQDEGDTEEEDEEDPLDRKKELLMARDEMLGHIESAYHSASVTLDFISLLLSKDTPVQATLSMSPALKEIVPLGTLGVDRLQAPRIDKAQKDDNKRIAKGWKIQNINKTVDTILDSATRLEKEIESETKYWGEVLAISEKGWAVCRIPSEKQTLGVRFGFPEASLTFKNQSLAALRRNADGSIALDQGFAGSEPQVLRVRVQVNGVDTGSSAMPNAVADTAPVEAFILQARNTIFSSELWQELNRESRILGGLGVQAVDDIIVLSFNSTKKIVLDLVPLNDSTPLSSQPDDRLAEGIKLSLNLLLSFAHRQNHRRRTQPPPPISGRKRQTPSYNLLRPIITRLNHQRSIDALSSLLSDLRSIFSSASLSSNAEFKITHSPPQPPPIPNISNAERTVLALTSSLEATAIFKITPTTTISVVSQTAQAPAPTIIYIITLNPESPLTVRFSAPAQPLTTFTAVKEYILHATSCALAADHTSRSPSDNEIHKSAPGKSGWHLVVQPNVLRKIFEGGKGKHLGFHFDRKEGSGLRFRVVWDWMRFDLNDDSNIMLGKEEERIRGEGVYEWRSKRRQGGKEWEDGEGEVVRSLGDVIEGAGRWVDV